ncbi:MmcQ/YjbR family DNA-binding protein [Phycicoccus avicenniae]|uniref:MmcQ/YjbR family DNA-binding protein n=1 Tax=Phycicoccus avicenniae TaxID=2828860 RepID=UPI003D2B2654
MAHPARFDDDDPLLVRVRDIALGLPGADEKVSHGRPTFFTKKVFAIFGGVVKGDHGSDALRQALVFLPEADERPALLEDPRVSVPGYEGTYGWLALDLRGDVDWGEVAELVESSYRATAPARLITELDARTA